ncbi:hypothetical protein OH77DRAFT_182164 [Trametes cingulata]|nr:hypothetical protein OH77DRAFT_182164 [Trametes cingulata]
MHQLRVIWLEGSIWDAATLAHLGSLTSLSALVLECGWYSPSYAACDQLLYKPFPSLRQLLVSAAHREDLEFLTHVDPLALDTVTVQWRYSSMGNLSHGALLQGTFTRVHRFKQLRHLTICMPAEDAHNLAGLPNGPSYLEPVLSVSSLQTLQIAHNIVVQLDDQFLSRLAQGLPRLQTLSLVPPTHTGFGFIETSDEEDEDIRDLGSDPPDYLPSLGGLCTLAAGCKQLTRLGLGVRATFRGKRGRLARNVQRPSGIRSLELWTTPLDPAVPDDDFVDFFASAFPALKALRVLLPIRSYPANTVYAEASREEACERWDAVLDQLRNRLQGLRVRPMKY